MLDETLVIFSGEFGRTPFVQGTNGRDHNPYGFSLWMAGGGLKKGFIYGQTDEYGYRVVENSHTVRDLHATVLTLLGLDYQGLTYRFGGRDFRLADVDGHPDPRHSRVGAPGALTAARPARPGPVNQRANRPACRRTLSRAERLVEVPIVFIGEVRAARPKAAVELASAGSECGSVHHPPAGQVLGHALAHQISHRTFFSPGLFLERSRLLFSELDLRPNHGSMLIDAAA